MFRSETVINTQHQIKHDKTSTTTQTKKLEINQHILSFIAFIAINIVKQNQKKQKNKQQYTLPN